MFQVICMKDFVALLVCFGFGSPDSHTLHSSENPWPCSCWFSAAGGLVRAASALWHFAFLYSCKSPPLCPMLSPLFLRHPPSTHWWNTFSGSSLGKGEYEATFWNMSYFHTCWKLLLLGISRYLLCCLDITFLGLAYETASPSKGWETCRSVSFFGKPPILFCHRSTSSMGVNTQWLLQLENLCSTFLEFFS